MNINQLVRYWAKTRPQQPAIIFDHTTTTWRQLDQLTDALARGLHSSGVRPGDRVGLLMRNSVELAALMLATLKLGAIVAPLNFRLIDKEVAQLLVDAEPRLVVADDDLRPLLDVALAERPFPVITRSGTNGSSYDDLVVDTGAVPDVDVAEDAPAFLCYTSGTTGTQKGALLTHRGILAVGRSQALAHGINGADRVLAAAPLVYTGSCISVFVQSVVYPGATMVLLGEFDPERGLDAIIEHRVTASTMVPVIWEMMSRLPRFAQIDVDTFRYAGAGGAPVSPDLLEAYRSRGIPLNQVYGLTESSGLAASLRYEDALDHPGYAGLPLVGTEIHIGAPDGALLGPDEVGEILVRGPHVMQGYWRRPTETAETLVDGWLRTGDLGLQNEGGFLKLVDRSKDMLISGGINVYPAEIERALAGVPGVVELAVIGVPHDKWGEVPMVVLHAEAGSTAVAQDLARAVDRNLARFKQPKYAVVHGEPLPRTFSGKLAKPLLRQRYPAVPADAVPLAAVPEGSK